MNIEFWSLLTILAMAATTYLTRIAGFLIFHNRSLSERWQHVLQQVPGCVLVSVIAPAFVSGKLADCLALLVTFLAAARLSLLPTVLLAIGSAALFRYWLGA